MIEICKCGKLVVTKKHVPDLEKHAHKFCQCEEPKIIGGITRGTLCLNHVLENG